MLKKLAIFVVPLVLAFGLMLALSRSASFAVHDELLIEATPAGVWPVLMAVGDWPLWWPGVERAALASGWAVGAALDLALTGDPASAPARIACFRPGQELGWSRAGILGSMTWTTLRVEGRPAGTLVTITTAVGGPQAVLARFTGREAFTDYQRRVLAGLGERVAWSVASEGAGEGRDE